MALLSHLFGLRGTVGRSALWKLFVVRTLLGVGFVQIQLSDLLLDDAYQLVVGIALFWPAYVAFPVRRLRELGRSWRTWALVWGMTILLAAPATVAAAASGQGRATAWIGDVPVGWTVSPDAVPPATIVLLSCAAAVQALYGICLYFVPPRARWALESKHGHALAS